MKTKSTLLLLAGLSSTAVALLHLLIIYLGAPAYRYFGAGEEMARMAEKGSIIPVIVTLGVTLVLGIFALYAFSGAGKIRPLPALRILLIGIGAIFSLRGLAVFYELYAICCSHDLVFIKEALFSAVSLGIGLLYLAGSYQLIKTGAPV